VNRTTGRSADLPPRPAHAADRLHPNAALRARGLRRAPGGTVPRACHQAIAKAETVSGNAARLGRSVHPCVCKTPGQDRLAALLLLVGGEARSRPATHSPRPLMRASGGVPVVPADRVVHRAGLTGHGTTSGRQEGRSAGTTPARGSRYATIWELHECSMSRSSDRLRSSGEGPRAARPTTPGDHDAEVAAAQAPCAGACTSSTATCPPPPRHTPRSPAAPRTSPSATTWAAGPPALEPAEL
jgi:hypothetical protein